MEYTLGSRAQIWQENTASYIKKIIHREPPNIKAEMERLANDYIDVHNKHINDDTATASSADDRGGDDGRRQSQSAPASTDEAGATASTKSETIETEAGSSGGNGDQSSKTRCSPWNTVVGLDANIDGADSVHRNDDGATDENATEGRTFTDSMLTFFTSSRTSTPSDIEGSMSGDDEIRSSISAPDKRA